MHVLLWDVCSPLISTFNHSLRCICLLTFSRADFLAGQYFDIRLEIHAPINGSEATGVTTPNEDFTLEIAKKGEAVLSAADYFEIPEVEVETWNFTWYEGKL